MGGGELNLEFSQRGKTFGVGHENYLQDIDLRHTKMHASGPVI